MKNQQKINSQKVIFFTNIIAPYRIFLFNELERLGQDKNFDFEVYFMRKTESNRSWNIDLSTIKFKYQVGNGLYFRIKTYFGHFNPILLYKLIKGRNEIILGASWNNPNVMFLAFLKSLGLLKNKFSVWSEANYLTNESQSKNKLRDNLKKWFFSQIDGNFIVPGKMAVLSFQQWEIPYQNIVMLPNLVDNSIFQKRETYVINENLPPIFFLVARLEEEIKGIKNFLQALGDFNIKKIKLRIAGTGSSLPDYISYVNEHNLQENVSFLGNLNQKQISQEYQNADVFVLPSFSDPSPLTIIEAIFSGLPVFVSNRCGNHFEAVEEGINGYTFNPTDHDEIRSKFTKLISERSKWSGFSEKSYHLALKNFYPEIKLSEFIDSY